MIHEKLLKPPYFLNNESPTSQRDRQVNRYFNYMLVLHEGTDAAYVTRDHELVKDQQNWPQISHCITTYLTYVSKKVI